MTPAQERALLESTATAIERDLRDAFERLLDLIRDGTDPREAVDTVMATFSGELAAAMAAGLTRMLSESVGSAEALEIRVGSVHLSQRLYAEAQAAGVIVQGIVRRHAQGWQDARTLALELFEGYGHRDPAAEPLKLSPRNERLPKYLREALIADPGVAGALTRAYAGMQVDRLSTPALRAAYRDALDAIARAERGVGDDLLEKRLRIAFFERMRYFAGRIAQTELHRAYAAREAVLLMEDEAVEYVQIRRAAGRRRPCICALMTGRDLYGLGSGVYPKAVAPVPPLHPFCRCIQAPRLDLTGRRASDRDESGDAYFLRRLDAPIAARIMGSQAKRDAVLAGTPAEAVANAGRDPLYAIQRTGDVARLVAMGL